MNADLQKAAVAELEMQKSLMKAVEAAAAEGSEIKMTSENLQGEINRLKRCTESQSRDLKRAMREKDILEKDLQESKAALAAAIASSASLSASDVVSRKSFETPALLVKSDHIICYATTLLFWCLYPSMSIFNTSTINESHTYSDLPITIRLTSQDRLQVPFKSLKSASVSPLSQQSVTGPPEVSYVKGIKSSSHVSSKGPHLWLFAVILVRCKHFCV